MFVTGNDLALSAKEVLDGRVLQFGLVVIIVCKVFTTELLVLLEAVKLVVIIIIQELANVLSQDIA